MPRKKTEREEESDELRRLIVKEEDRIFLGGDGDPRVLKFWREELKRLTYKEVAELRGQK